MRRSITISQKDLDDKKYVAKRLLQKKRVEICNEINMLSVARIQDLHQELGNSNKDFCRSMSPKKFDDYFAFLKRKLDRLNQINKKEKESLKSFNFDNSVSFTKEPRATSLIHTSKASTKVPTEPAGERWTSAATPKQKYVVSSHANRGTSIHVKV